MIIEMIIGAAAGFIGWLSDGFAEIELPGWVIDGTEAVYGFIEGVSGLGAWFPWEVLATVIGSLVVVFLITLGVKTILKIAAFFPFIGGSG